MVANQLYELCEAVGPEHTRWICVTCVILVLDQNKNQVSFWYSSWYLILGHLLLATCSETFLSNVVKSKLNVKHVSYAECFVRHVRFEMLCWTSCKLSNVYINVSSSDLVPAYVRLLRDNEAEVRIAAAGKVTKFSRILNPELAIQHILPCVKVWVFCPLMISCSSVTVCSVIMQFSNLTICENIL